MTLTFAWEAISALCAVFALVMAGAVAYVRNVVRVEIDQAINRINGMYVRSEKCLLIHENTLTRFASIEHRIDRLEEVADE